MSARGERFGGQAEIEMALAAMAEAVDPRAGIRERFLTPTIGGGRTVAVLACPLAEIRDTGWVICHSYGMEQVNLATHEVPVARKLAGAGFPVLRFHGQGYGDSELAPDCVSIASHVRDARDAAAVLRETTGVANVAFLGARFGGTVAALVANELSAEAFIAWDPVARGRPYARTLLTLSVMLKLMHDEREDQDAPDPENLLREHGVLDVQGFPLTLELYEELLHLDLPQRIDSFRGRSLVVQISKRPEPRAELERLVARVRELGGAGDLEVIVDERANSFAEPRFRPVPGGRKVDLQEALAAQLLSMTVSWAAASPPPPARAVS